VPLREPSWWYGEPGTPPSPPRLLNPLARLYGRIAERRLRFAQPYTSLIPVICIGNFTAGGTGKTPLTLLLAEYARTIGLSPAILTRGYGGTLRGPHLVNPETDSALKTGDEALLLARTAPTLVCRDRPQGARWFEAMADPPSLVIMDDGLQNASIAKMLRIAVVDARRGIGNGLVIPAGPLRAPLKTQLEISDVIIINAGPINTSDINSEASAATPSGDTPQDLARLFRTEGFKRPILRGGIIPRTNLAALRGKPVLAFAGIAHPERFFRTLRLGGIEIAETVTYKDHHFFDAGDAEHLLQRANALGAQLVTTEKDHVRLLSYDDQRAELAERTTALGVTMVIAEEDRGTLEKMITLAVRPPSLDGNEKKLSLT
jgi:tetraacyldisaccharide 4'-kinase